MYNSPKQSGIILLSKEVYFSQWKTGILLPSKWYTSPNGKLVYFSQANGILLPMENWYTSPKQMVYFSQANGILLPMEN
ncbi:hypothetical protein Tco_0346918, partial [Tanacetum coccineum]